MHSRYYLDELMYDIQTLFYYNARPESYLDQHLGVWTFLEGRIALAIMEGV